MTDYLVTFSFVNNYVRPVFAPLIKVQVPKGQNYYYSVVVVVMAEIAVIWNELNTNLGPLSGNDVQVLPKKYDPTWPDGNYWNAEGFVLMN